MVNQISDEDICPERPSGAKDLSLTPAKEFYPACPDPVGEESGTKDLSAHPTRIFVLRSPPRADDEGSLYLSDDHRHGCNDNPT